MCRNRMFQVIDFMSSQAIDVGYSRFSSHKGSTSGKEENMPPLLVRVNCLYKPAFLHSNQASSANNLSRHTLNNLTPPSYTNKMRFTVATLAAFLPATASAALCPAVVDSSNVAV